MYLDDEIDDLYRGPLGEFTAARNGLARTLTGAGAQRVRKLAKPTLIAWAVNQLYWRARPVYDRLLKSGAALRDAQLGALKGKRTDVRAAAETHRAALAAAVARAVEIAGAQGARPEAEPLARMLEAVSLAGTHPERPGRLTRPAAPAGLEALKGLLAPRRRR
jgi:hypothetical protein